MPSFGWSYIHSFHVSSHHCLSEAKPFISSSSHDNQTFSDIFLKPPKLIFLTSTCCMEALNAASLKPVSVLSEKRTEPKRISSFPSSSQLKFTKPTVVNSTPPSFPQVLSTKLNGGLLFLSSVLNAGLAKALTYEEALGMSVGSSSSESTSDFDVGGIVDSVISFGTENSVLIIGGATLLAVPLVLSRVLNKPKAWGIESAKNAYAKLGEVAEAQLLDIRTPVDVKEVGSADLRGLKKKAASIVYKGEDKPGFLKKLSLKFKEPENTTLFILDKFDGNSELVAELVTANGFKAAYAIKDGAEGPRGWLKSGLPWIEPKKTLSLDFGNLAETFSDVLGEGSALSVGLGVAAASGLSLLAFTEIETILQLLGSAALIQLVGKKFLYAEDRKETLQQVDEFLNTKIAPKELVDEIKQIGKALLPITVENKALPVPEEAIQDAALPNTTELKAEGVPELKAELEVKEAAETPVVNSVPKTEVQAESLPRPSSSLSPYPYYPDLKPPASPSPSQPLAVNAVTKTELKAEPVPEVKAELVPEVKAEPVSEAKAEPVPEVQAEAVSEAKAEPVPEVQAEAVSEVKAESVPEVKAEAVPEVEAESVPVSSSSLSPYPYYADLKPPASPSPSQP